MHARNQHVIHPRFHDSEAIPKGTLREGKACTWKKRRRGLGGPLEGCEGWEEDWLHATLPSLPALTLQPETTSSKNHKSGFFCHNTNPPISQLRFAFMSPVWWMSDDTIFTCPTAYMLCTELSAASPPVAARYCCTMYFAVEASWSHKWMIQTEVWFLKLYCSFVHFFLNVRNYVYRNNLWYFSFNFMNSPGSNMSFLTNFGTKNRVSNRINTAYLDIYDWFLLYEKRIGDICQVFLIIMVPQSKRHID